LKEHRKFYSIFNIIGIWKTMANTEVERRIKDNFTSLNVLIDLKIKGLNRKKEENRREHIILTEKYDLDYCLDMITKVVNSTFHPQEDVYKKEIAKLEHKNELLTEKNNNLVELNNQLRASINQLRDNIKNLRFANCSKMKVKR